MKEYMVIEAHTHYLPPEALTVPANNSFDVAALAHSDSKIQVKRTQDIDGLVRIMEDSGVDMAVLAMAQQSTLGLEVCKVMNKNYAAVGRKYPGKFILCGHIPLEPGKAVTDEIERCINGFGFKGIALPSSFPDVSLDSPTLWPIYEKNQSIESAYCNSSSDSFPHLGRRKAVSAREYNLQRI